MSPKNISIGCAYEKLIFNCNQVSITNLSFFSFSQPLLFRIWMTSCKICFSLPCLFCYLTKWIIQQFHYTAKQIQLTTMGCVFKTSEHHNFEISYHKLLCLRWWITQCIPNCVMVYSLTIYNYMSIKEKNGHDLVNVYHL